MILANSRKLFSLGFEGLPKEVTKNEFKGITFMYIGMGKK